MASFAEKTSTQAFQIIFLIYVFLIGCGGINLKPFSIPLSVGGSLERVFPIVLLTALCHYTAIKRAFKFYGFPLLLVACLGATSVLPYYFFATDMESRQMTHIYWMGLCTFFFTVLSMQDTKYLKKIMICVIVSVTVLILKGMVLCESVAHKAIEVIPGQNRLVTEIGHPNFLGGFILLVLPFSLLLPSQMFQSKLRHRLFYLVTNGILISGLLMSFSRSAWLGLGVLLVLILCRKSYLIVISLCLGLTLSFIWQDFNMEIVNAEHPVLLRLQSVFDFQNDPNFLERLYVWKSSVFIGLDHIATGIGLGNIPFYRQIEIFRQPESIMLMPHSHNVFLQFFVSFGLMGFILFMAILILGLKHTVSQSNIQNVFLKYMHRAVLYGAVSFFIYGLFDSPVFSDRVTHLFWFFMALLYFRPPFSEGATEK